jgi:hypothetical protein
MTFTDTNNAFYTCRKLFLVYKDAVRSLISRGSVCDAYASRQVRDLVDVAICFLILC